MNNVKIVKNGEVLNKLLPLIRKYSYNKNITLEDVFVFEIKLIDNEVDKDYQYFSAKCLHDIAEKHIGQLGYIGNCCNARIIKTDIFTDTKVKTKTGEDFTYIIATAFVNRTNEIKDIVYEIENGCKKDASISCSINMKQCTICGTDNMKKQCHHKLGNIYGSRTCYQKLSGIVECYEWSVINCHKTNILKNENCKNCRHYEQDEYNYKKKYCSQGNIVSANPENDCCAYYESNIKNKNCDEDKTNIEKIKNVDHPNHYNQGGIECIEALEAATQGLSGSDAVCTSNAIKYLWRWKYKNGVEDLEKAVWYIERLIKKYINNDK